VNEFSFPPDLSPQTLDFVDDLFGGVVPCAQIATTQLMHRLESEGNAWENWQVRIGGGANGAIWLRWTMWVHWPADHKNNAVLLSPDACWPFCVNQEAANVAAKQGVALAWFNRLELAQDGTDGKRVGPVFDQWPERPFGALAVWAWGLQRCVDALLCTGRTQAGHIGVVGHSRGGKAALLAGATDNRIGATISHNSGTGGAASFQHMGEGSERLEVLASRFPHWLGPYAAQADTQRRIVDTDCLTLLQAIAPRGLCLLQASDDDWANPIGTRHCFEMLQPEWAAMGAMRRLQWQERTGGHSMTALDWQRAATFVQHVIQYPPT
jgi:dienelactone hydrolase